MSKRVNFLALFFLFLFVACDQSDDLAGGSTDVETGGISGVAKVNSDSLLSEGTLIILNQIQESEDGEVQLIADSLQSTIVNKKGLFQFDSLNPGIYSIESYQESTGKRNLNREVEVISDSTIAIESIMHTPGSIKLTNIPEEIQDPAYEIYIPHLRLQKSLKVNTSSLTLDSIPAGVSIEVRYKKSLIDQGLITTITLAEGLDAVINWP